jgi:hypothetical protein
VLRRSTMFIAVTNLESVRSSGAPCALMAQVYIPLLTERKESGYQGYKHVALRSRSLALTIMTFLQRPMGI